MHREFCDVLLFKVRICFDGDLKLYSNDNKVSLFRLDILKFTQKLHENIYSLRCECVFVGNLFIKQGKNIFGSSFRIRVVKVELAFDVIMLKFLIE